ncbi:hypothetical protein [Vulcanisaeta sp. JCM 16161]|uniref:hypothetical protein n=1 Tax=Vulcanisaeta sp. JCM 16161 TaxID=1295372 RepID=UPI000ABB694E|nr:hypothetical protein [Vulcanisaeta sp. JCM 16161]
MSNYIVNVSIDGFTFRIPVSIVTKDDTYYYIVKEPRCDTQCMDLRGKVIDLMRQRGMAILDAINESVKDLGNKQLVESVIYHLLRDLRGYGPITVPLFDPNIEEVELNNWTYQ